MDDVTRAAFERLITVARSDTGQAKRVTSFILAWWNAAACGGFDLADLFSVDRAIAADMATVFAYLAHYPGGAVYPAGYRSEIEGPIQRWHPAVWADNDATA